MVIISFVLNILAAVLILDCIRASRLGVLETDREAGRTPGPIATRLQAILKRAGLISKADRVFYVIIPFGMFIMGIPVAILIDPAGGFVLMVFPVTISWVMHNAIKKRHNSVFQKNAYRIYKYILNQISAGVRPADALRSMYEVIEDKTLSKIFTEACASYSVSYDTRILADELIRSIDSPESRSLAMSIRDGLFESRDEALLERLEQMMFNRYFAYVQRMTDSLRTRCLVTVVLLCAVIVCMILIPTVMDVQDALNSIFS